MKTVAFVPVKLNSERTPGKNIRKFSDGTPLLTLFLKILVKCKELDEIYVFCSNEKIKEYLIPGVKFLKRPEFLDLSTATGNDLITEFVKLVDADIYSMCHCTSPFIKPEHIDECVKAVKSGEYDSSYTAEELHMLLWKENGEALNFDPANIPRTQDLEPLYNETVASYAFTKDMFLKYHRRIGMHPHITKVKGIECIDIDYPEDFEIADAIYTYINKGQDKNEH